MVLESTKFTTNCIAPEELGLAAGPSHRHIGIERMASGMKAAARADHRIILNLVCACMFTAARARRARRAAYRELGQ
eukprot:SAG31_NODE_3617_length_4064_cov_41.284741_2_plen_77_part_00